MKFRQIFYRNDNLSKYVSLIIGYHLGNWSKIHEKANQISQITEVNHNQYAS